MDEKTEGGVNLNMPPEVIAALNERGREAGVMLIDRFTSSPDKHVLPWDNHRWVRYRSLMRLLQQMLEDIEDSFSNTTHGEQGYWDLIRRSSKAAPESYPWRTKTQQSFAEEATQILLELAQDWRNKRSTEAAASFGGDVPNPLPEIRIRPRI